jgi:uncharacterized protein
MSETRHQIIPLIRRYVAVLEARGIAVECVILFGSHAAGHAHEWSDIDLAVISSTFDEISLLERFEHLGLANSALHAPLDVVGFSPSQVATCEPSSFLREILNTGIEISLSGKGSASSRPRRRQRAG